MANIQKEKRKTEKQNTINNKEKGMKYRKSKRKKTKGKQQINRLEYNLGQGERKISGKRVCFVPSRLNGKSVAMFPTTFGEEC